MEQFARPRSRLLLKPGPLLEIQRSLVAGFGGTLLPHMKKDLDILIIEDVVQDAELIGEELRASGMTFHTRRVETRDEFLAELQRSQPDIVLSDFTLPPSMPLRPFIFCGNTNWISLSSSSPARARKK
jgi:hypothetical protein